MSVEFHYLERIALATEQTAREVKKLADILGRLSLQLEDTQKTLDQITTTPQPIKKIQFNSEMSNEEYDFQKWLGNYMMNINCIIKPGEIDKIKEQVKKAMENDSR